MKQVAVSFSTSEQAAEALQRIQLEFPLAEIFSPFEFQAMDIQKSKFPAFAALCGGVFGWCLGWGLEVMAAVIDFPLNIGARPNFSWPSFVPVAFVLMILFGGVSVFVSFMWSLRFPELHHPIFDLKDFDLSKDRFYLLIPVRDLSSKARLSEMLGKDCEVLA